jgi:pyruvate/2-oxoglutarate/acetoin dehydrogenase E1 component
VMPTTPYDAKGMLIAAVEDPNPVIFIEHRWLHHVFGPVPEGRYTVPLGSSAVVREGKDVSIVATSLSLLESLRAADALAAHGIDAEVIDVRTLKPLDSGTILASVAKTGALLAVDHGWRFLGFAGEVVATVAEQAFGQLKHAPRRVTAPDRYVATSPALADATYPYTIDIVNEVLTMFGKPALTETQARLEIPARRDVPQPSFRGPF